MIIKVNRLKKIVQESGKRLSSEAAKAMDEYLEKGAREIIRKAAVRADFQGRKTIKKEDIRAE